MKTAGFVLVGGQSTRMGRDKARLLIDTKPMAETTAAKVAQVSDAVYFIGNPAFYSDLAAPCIADLRAGMGPLGGLEAAIASGYADFNIVTGCDMPGLQPQWLRQLLSTAESSGALCVAAKDSSGRIHPLCAVYRSACLPFIRQALDARRLRLLDLIEDLQAVAVPVDAVIANLNTPEQFETWRARLSA